MAVVLLAPPPSLSLPLPRPPPVLAFSRAHSSQNDDSLWGADTGEGIVCKLGEGRETTGAWLTPQGGFCDCRLLLPAAILLQEDGVVIDGI